MKTLETDEKPVVFILDDDQSVRNALNRLFRLMGLHPESFATATDFLNTKLPDVPSCLVLDIRLPGISGLDVQAELLKADAKIPIIFMTGHGDIPMAVEAMKAGAIEFLPKPFRDQDILDAVQLALERDRTRRQAEGADAQLRASLERLSRREWEVMALITAGLMNKEIATKLGLAEVTVKFHRGNLMRKMNAWSVVELARMAQILGIERSKS